jgi:hypothetical protein
MFMRILKVSDTRLVNLDRVIDIRFIPKSEKTSADLTLDYGDYSTVLSGEMAERIFGTLLLEAREPATLVLLADYRSHKEPEF